MKKLISLLLVSLMVIGMVACGAAPADESKAPAQDTPATTENPNKRLIGIATYTMDNAALYPLLQSMIDGVTSRGDDYVLVSAKSSDDTEGIVRVVEELVNRDDIDGILVDNINDTVLTDVVAQAKAKGVPMVFNDIAFAPDEDHPILANVLNDNYAAGKAVAERCVEDLGGEGNVILYAYWGNEACRPRSQAIYDVFEQYPGITVLHEGMVTLDVAAANQNTEDLLMTYPDVDAIISIVDNAAIGAVSAIKAQGRDGIKVYAIDGSENICPLIESGDVVCSIAQDFVAMGAKTADVLYDYFDGKEIEDTYMVDIKVIDSTTVAEWIEFYENSEYDFK